MTSLLAGALFGVVLIVLYEMGKRSARRRHDRDTLHEYRHRAEFIVHLERHVRSAWDSAFRQAIQPDALDVVWDAAYLQQVQNSIPFLREAYERYGHLTLAALHEEIDKAHADLQAVRSAIRLEELRASGLTEQEVEKIDRAWTLE